MRYFKVFAAMLLVACVGSAGCVKRKYEPGPYLADLEVAFADAAWDGKTVPEGQQCRRFGGAASTPSLVVGNIPIEANALILEYSDRTYTPMDHGCHGKIGYRLPDGATEVTVPAVPAHTFDLPEGFFTEKAHCNPSYDKAGAYLPPCSGGKGNLYYGTVKAVYIAPEGKQSKLLGLEKLNLGRY